MFEFVKTDVKEIENHFTTPEHNPDSLFFQNILNAVIEESHAFYTKLYEEKISHLGPHEDFITVLSIL